MTPDQLDVFIKSQEAAQVRLDAMRSFTSWAVDVSNSGTHIQNPYHNGRHMMCVLSRAKRIYVAESGEPPTPELIFACMMHDYNHTGGKFPDAVNIERAIAGVRKFQNHPRLACVTIGRVIELIECTYFDGSGFPNEPKTLGQQALRDADLMAIYENDATEQLYGLWNELTRTRKLTLDQFIEGNANFLRNAKMYTAYGNDVKDNWLETCLSRFESEVRACFAKEQQ